MFVNTDNMTTRNNTRYFNVMVAGRCAKGIDQIERIIAPLDNLQLKINHLCNGHSDPLSGAVKIPDMLIFWVGKNWQIELEEFIKHPVSERPPLLICADHDDPQLMRLAMKAGAVDYLSSPIDVDELVASTRSVMNKFLQSSETGAGTTIAVMNAKGGSGASFLACNIADLMTESSKLNVALIGLDIQFGSLSGYLDLDVKYGLMDALDNIDEMDSDALRGYMMRHSSGIDLLDVKPGELLTPEDIETDHLARLFDLLTNNYDQVIVDLPRHIDMLTSTVIDGADKLLIVLQQSIAHLHDAKRLLDILSKDLAVPKEKIMLVINRYDKSSDMTLKSILSTLNHDNYLTIPNAFDQVSKSIDGGEPLYSSFRRATITKALLSVKDNLLGSEPESKQAVFERVINKLRVF